MELFTVEIESNSTINVDFSNEVRQLFSVEELEVILEKDLNKDLIPLVAKLVDNMKEKLCIE